MLSGVCGHEPLTCSGATAPGHAAKKLAVPCVAAVAYPCPSRGLLASETRPRWPRRHPSTRALMR
eukprot:scaffold43125_cov57-Phaeocystis_antarctica.AAC.1